MHTIMVANPKGGCGKSTLAIHLASWFAHCDEIVCLADLDRQQSSAEWLKRRPSTLPPIRAWASEDGTPGAPPRDCGVGILDTPAGLHGKALRQLLREVDRVIVPVAPSRFDMLASRDFFDELAETKAVRKDRVGVAIVGMRVDPRTNASQQMLEFLQQFDLPLVTCIRNTQRYVQAVETGETLFDPGRNATGDLEQWRPLLDWLVTRRT
ncbi:MULTISPECIES: ParA family protein [Zoogloea]|jgi:chromosome partitioning protein|uniref:ParA family protein n=1 Tax=Zoogloea oleivorans TaxID=1552750 RepID=A0A6C2D6Y5_9RHOO|nr:MULTISPECIES: ParA family protein [Zoogloea]MBT9497148.1 ParA family protein [Zoogloea sp.]MDD2667553.1 ParA family protein [Zoogloea sp.]MDY0036974.1 ParA family protein [Zoogloea oleivorans]TYC62268.1 ParA family protein [Zoogloea oleivorans]